MQLQLLAAAFAGLIIGNGVAWLVERQARTSESPPAVSRTALDWLPIGGAVIRRDWFTLLLELLTAATAAQLVGRFGWTVQGGLAFVAGLVLIDTGAVDWRVKLIDVLLLLVATAVALATAPLRGLTWRLSLQGLGVGFALFVFFFLLAKMMYPGKVAPFGLGDVYLGTFIGAVVGFRNLYPALFYGMALAGLASIALIMVLGYKKARYIAIPYGSYLCLGALLALLFLEK